MSSTSTPTATPTSWMRDVQPQAARGHEGNSTLVNDHSCASLPQDIRHNDLMYTGWDMNAEEPAHGHQPASFLYSGGEDSASGYSTIEDDFVDDDAIVDFDSEENRAAHTLVAVGHQFWPLSPASNCRTTEYDASDEETEDAFSRCSLSDFDAREYESVQSTVDDDGHASPLEDTRSVTPTLEVDGVNGPIASLVTHTQHHTSPLNRETLNSSPKEQEDPKIPQSYPVEHLLSLCAPLNRVSFEISHTRSSIGSTSGGHRLNPLMEGRKDGLYSSEDETEVGKGTEPMHNFAGFTRPERLCRMKESWETEAASIRERMSPLKRNAAEMSEDDQKERRPTKRTRL
ncbi:hypothetical protein CPB86DRAFT_877916 [Serendipita vermifera]|nr:hypothetical protein CPB86DRAFT_877916 [Serendipita vermifera]